jgi:hypothetical protein
LGKAHLESDCYASLRSIGKEAHELFGDFAIFLGEGITPRLLSIRHFESKGLIHPLVRVLKVIIVGWCDDHPQGNGFLLAKIDELG